MNKEMRNKSFALIFAALMIASVSAIMMPVEAQEHGGVAIGTAQTPTTGGPVPAGVTPNITIQTIAYLSFSPNPIGVGQQLLGKPLATTSIAGQSSAHRIHRSNYKARRND